MALHCKTLNREISSWSRRQTTSLNFRGHDARKAPRIFCKHKTKISLSHRLQIFLTLTTLFFPLTVQGSNEAGYWRRCTLPDVWSGRLEQHDGSLRRLQEDPRSIFTRNQWIHQFGEISRVNNITELAHTSFSHLFCGTNLWLESEVQALLSDSKFGEGPTIGHRNLEWRFVYFCKTATKKTPRKWQGKKNKKAKLRKPTVRGPTPSEWCLLAAVHPGVGVDESKHVWCCHTPVDKPTRNCDRTKPADRWKPRAQKQLHKTTIIFRTEFDCKFSGEKPPRRIIFDLFAGVQKTFEGIAATPDTVTHYSKRALVTAKNNLMP